jgi:hypothetical protein
MGKMIQRILRSVSRRLDRAGDHLRRIIQHPVDYFVDRFGRQARGAAAWGTRLLPKWHLRMQPQLAGAAPPPG